MEEQLTNGRLYHYIFNPLSAESDKQQISPGNQERTEDFVIEGTSRYSIQWQNGRDIAPIRAAIRALFYGVSGACSSGKIFEIDQVLSISTQSSSAHVEERDQELWGTLEQDCL